MSSTPPNTTARLVVRPALAEALARAGVADEPQAAAVVYDPFTSHLASWADVESALTRAFRLAADAKREAAPIVFVVDGAAVYGHTGPLLAMLANGLLGAMRNQAVEGQRKGISAYAVTASSAPDADLAPVARAVAWALSGAPSSGQVLYGDDPHIGRPAA